RRQKKVGRNEHRGGERDQRLRVRAADMEQKEKDQRGLEKIVAEGREKLGPEQGREAPRHQQRRGHGFSAGSNGRGAQMRAPLTRLTSWQPHCPLPPQAGRGHVPRRRPTGADGLRDDNLGKRTIAPPWQGKAQALARYTNGDGAQNKGGRPGAARRSGPARVDFAIGGEAACRAPTEWLRRSNKRRPRMRA